MKKILIALAGLLLSGSLFSQVTFQKTYDISFFDLFTSIEQTTDNGYLMTGRDLSGMLQIQTSVMKTDSAGVVTWAYNYGDNEFLSFIGTYFVNDAKQTSDGGYILTGNCYSNGGGYDDLLLLKLDANGNITWSRGYGGGDADAGNFVIQTSDGGYLAVGYTYSFGTKDSTNIYMVKTNSTGTMQWDRAYQISPNDDDAANSVEEHAGGYILTGYTTQLFAGVDTTQDIVLIGTDLSGNNPWVHTYGTDSHTEYGTSIERINASSLVVTGSNDESVSGLDAVDIFLMEINTSGSATWCAAYDIGFADEAQYVHRISGGGYNVVGFTIASLFPLSLKSFILKVNSAANVEWSRRYGTGINFSIFSRGEQTSDGGFIIGTIGGMGYDYYMIKTDQDGWSNCNEEAFTANKRSYSPLMETPAYTQFSGGSNHSNATSKTTKSPTSNTLCIEIPCDTPVVSVTPPSATICGGQSVTLTASGADTYSWNTGATTAAISVSPSSTTTYTVTGMTGGICPSYPVNVTVTVNATPVASISGNSTICVGQSTTLTASGGNSYSWSSGQTTAAITVNPASTTTYTVTVTNTATGCTATASQAVTVNPLPTANITGTNVICAGQSTVLTASGGDAYNWDIGQTTAAISVSPASTTTYTVTVTNTTTGCTATDWETVTVNPLPNITITGDTSLCQGESTTLTASGGDTYSWSTTETTTSITATPMTTTVYSVTVTNTTTGCTNTLSQTVHVNTIPVITFSGDIDICIGESTDITAAGGDGYEWETGALTATVTLSPIADTYYTVTVTAGSTACLNVDSVLITVHPLPVVVTSGDDTICIGETAVITASGGTSYEWSSGDLTASASVAPVSTTTYSVTVTDGNNCSDTGTFQVFVNSLPVISFSGDTSLCLGDATDITASGGDDYLWSTTGTTATINVSPTVTTTYYITVTDNGTTCMNNDSITVNVHDLPLATAGPDTTVCENQPVNMTSGGGVSYTWGPIEGLSDPNIQNPVAILGSTTTFTVTVTDAFGCTDTETATVTINPAPDATVTGTGATCNGDHDGSAWISSVSGFGPFTYLWSNSATDTVLTGLTPGLFSVTITDAIGCTSVETYTVPEPMALADSTVIHNIGCYGGSDGSIQIYMSGGTSPYTYLWSTSQTTSSISNLSDGAYNVTVTDSHGCTLVISGIDILEPPALVVTSSGTDALCHGEASGSVSVAVTGGTPSYDYLWSTGDTLPFVYNLPSGLYYFTVTDAGGCDTSNYLSVYEPNGLAIADTAYYDPPCIESNEGYVCTSIHGGTGPYTYVWSTGATTQCITGLVAGEYKVTITDSHNCEIVHTYTLEAGLESCLFIPTLFTPNGDGINDYWHIQGIRYYSEIIIKVYNRWGDKVYEYNGSGAGYADAPWDGIWKGKYAPFGAYVFILDLKDGNEPLQGIVTVKN
ncbi:MAG: gliding motility-associated C-terminal domain-containing protein [Bacteroidota bacterium]